MKYSIVIITKNNRQRLIRLLELINKNLKGYSDYEVIVVEATDDLTTFKDNILHIKIPLKDAGFSYQRNIGVERASGEFIIFIDDDIEITSEWFNEITKEIWVQFSLKEKMLI